MSGSVRVFDTTLRDGEQSPGFSMTTPEKLRVAEQLAHLGVDIIEAGFPAASPGDLISTQQVARHVRGVTVAGLARASRGDIDAAWEAVREAEQPRIHTFISTSDLHIAHKLRKTREQVLEIARDAVAYAKAYTSDVEFSAEDASRTDHEYLCAVIQAAIDAGATTINVPDTVGYSEPEEFGALIRLLFERVPNIDKAVVSVHCHDDLGLATANTLAGVRAGAGQVEVTINGIGERAGNASLEEVVMALATRPASFGDRRTNVRQEELVPVSRLVSRLTGIGVQPNKAIVGENAFAHEAGIHQDGFLKNPLTYEIMTPQSVGWDATRLVLGKHSGRHALRSHIEGLGYRLEDDDLQQVFMRFKELADRKKTVDDRDIEALIADETRHVPETWRLEHVQITSGTGVTPVATVRLRGPDGEERLDSGHGTGPIDAIYKAIDRVVGEPTELQEFDISAITEGMDAVAEVTVRLRDQRAPEPYAGRRLGPEIHTGHGVNTDTIVACAEAYVSALNKMLAAREETPRVVATAAQAEYEKSAAV